MHAIYAAGIDRENPLSVLEIGDVEPVETPDDWVDVEVKAMSLNHHDVWALKGQALREEQVPMILGTDAAGIGPDGSSAVLHAVIGSPVRLSRTKSSARFVGTTTAFLSTPSIVTSTNVGCEATS